MNVAEFQVGRDRFLGDCGCVPLGVGLKLEIGISSLLVLSTLNVHIGQSRGPLSDFDGKVTIR